ncbi:MAG: hypothetical protein JW963_19500 [Anaerolineales bacterium]|nr:hypothetical protein [Anaerolineales bacterium]
MADKPKNELPKVPPFIIPGASNQRAEGPTPQAAHVGQGPKSRAGKNDGLSQQGMFSSLILLISVISLGVAMTSGAWFAYSVLRPVSDGSNNVLPKIIVVGLAYAVGWIFSVIGVRTFGNLILPYAIRIYAWVILGGIIALQILIISRLFQQEYIFTSYIKYLSMFGAGLVALIGLHLILEKHSLAAFAIPILLTSFAHLYFIVFHYIFLTEVKYDYLWGDVIFFIVTTLVSLLMLAHFGLLNGMRRLMDRMFSPKDNQFIS